MAKEKKETQKTEEREYVIPLRKEWRKVANYRRTGRAIKAIKQFIARHMKVPERDLSKVKLDVYLNQEVWFRGRKKPPAKIKVKVKKEGEFVMVKLAETPVPLKFAKLKHEKRHKPIPKAEKPKAAEQEKQTEQLTEEKKMEEKEKSQSAAEQKATQAKVEAKQQSHSKVKETPIHRKALKK